MSRPHEHESWTAAERAAVEALLDRIDDRLRDATSAIHAPGPPATPSALQAAALPPAVAALWARWDGLDLGLGEAVLLPLAAHEDATAEAMADGRLQPGDRVIGERGRDLLVLPEDPYLEGAEVVLVEEGSDRFPEASSVPHLVLGLLGELGVLLDEEGEYRDELFGDDGELLPAVERKLLRRRLDFDEGAPAARYRLAQLLRRNQEARAAKQELATVLRQAPEFMWAHYELGRTSLDLDQSAAGLRAFVRAAELATEPAMRAHFLAWATFAAPASERADFAQRVLSEMPTFVPTQIHAIASLVEQEHWRPARELIELALTVAPKQLELLDLRRRIPGDES